MNISLSLDDLRTYTQKQLLHFFPDKQSYKLDKKCFKLAIERAEYCFSKIIFYNKNGLSFNHLHSDQYLTFLWILSNQIWSDAADKIVATKLYYLNKALHGFDCLYNNNLPSIFYIAHGVGTVLGKASYDDYLYVCKGVTVGSSRGVNYPKFSKWVSLGSDSTVIGECTLEEMSSVGAGTSIFDLKVESKKAVIRDKAGELKIIHQNIPLSFYVFTK